MTDYAIQRKNMVESQLRPSDVTDRRILRAMGDISRERFVPEARHMHAYMDDPVPLGDVRSRVMAQRVLMSPRTFAKLLNIAAIADGDRVLIVGSGSGYSAAVIATFARSVVALESDHGLVEAARAALSTLPSEVLDRISLIEAPLAEGAPDRAPFDVIVMEGAVPELPAKIASQLAPGGRCVGILKAVPPGRATLWRRTGDHFAEADAFEVAAADLPGFARPQTFVL